MATEIETKIHGMLTEEKWTRAALNSFSVNNFKELDAVLVAVNEEKAQDDIKKILDEHLVHTKNSIIALYLSGILAIQKQAIDDVHLKNLISIFADNHRWNIVEVVCQRILDFGENKFALRTLAECYDHENQEEKKFEIWERLVKVDLDEATIAEALAKVFEERGDKAKSIDFYKKAIHRYIIKKSFNNIREIWGKLAENDPSDESFYFGLEKKISKNISDIRASQLIEELYPFVKKTQNWDYCLDLLKKILDYDPKNEWARKEITECYSGKFADHSQLQEYINISNLNQSWRNVHEAIMDFEKHIAFDVGNFVSHKTWGIGVISSIKSDNITIDFARKRGHEMNLKMAVSALATLSKNHIWVLKSVVSKEKLIKKIKENHEWALKTLIRSFGNQADMKQIKAELVPSLLTPSEWNTWSSNARKVLKSNPLFSNLPDNPDRFIFRDTPISSEEKLFNSFKAETEFFDKAKIMIEFAKPANSDSEFLPEMFSYFWSFVKSFGNVSEQVLCSWVLVKKISAQSPFLLSEPLISFSDLLAGVDSIETVFSNIGDSSLRKDVLEQIRLNVPEWPQIFVRLFAIQQDKSMVDTLEKFGHIGLIKTMVQEVVDSYRDKRELYAYLIKTFENESWFQDLGYSREKILLSMIYIMDTSFRDINNKKDVTNNRRLNKSVYSYLIESNALENYIKIAERESLVKIIALIDDTKDLDPALRIEFRHKILGRFPDFKFFDKEEKISTAARAILVTNKSYDEKQKALQYILDVEIPLNSKEIGKAIALGDLRENAEYKAGKEKQEMLNASVAKLKDEIDKSQIMREDEVNTNKVSFGTKVVLENLLSSTVEEYSIFGPWESDPSRNIISYMSPFGTELWLHAVGEELGFTINDKEYKYRVKEIKKADF